MSITADVRKERRGRGGENAAGVLLDRREKSYHDFLIGNKTNETNPGGVLRLAESTCGFPITDELNARNLVFPRRSTARLIARNQTVGRFVALRHGH